MKTKSLILLVTLSLGAACGEDPTACKAENHCISGDPSVCELGYQWVDPFAEDDYRCETAPADPQATPSATPPADDPPPDNNGGGSNSNNCSSGKKRCGSGCIPNSGECCNSSSGIWCETGECRADSSFSTGYGCFQPDPPALFPGIADIPLFAGAYWEYEWTSTGYTNGNVDSYSAGRFRIELGTTRQVNVPSWGGSFTMYRSSVSLVSGESIPINLDLMFTWVGKIGARVIGGKEKADGTLDLYRVYDGYTGEVRWGGPFGGHGGSGVSKMMRWVYGSTSYFNGTHIDAAEGTSSGGCTSAGSASVCTPYSGSGSTHYLHPRYGYLGFKSHITIDDGYAVMEQKSERGLVETNVDEW